MQRKRALAFGLLLTLAACGGAQPIDWPTTARAFHEEVVGTKLSLLCPAGGMPLSVWGTDVYTDDSSICTAGVHSEVLSFEEGGEVTVEFVSNPGQYDGSSRNGVTSEAFGPWERGFRVVR